MSSTTLARSICRVYHTPGRRYLQLTLVNVDAGPREVVPPETGPANARVTPHRVHALLVAAAGVLDLFTLIDVDAAAIPHEPGAVHALLIRRHRHRRRRRPSGCRNRRFRAAVTTRLIVADLLDAGVQPFRALVYVYNFKRETHARL